LGVIGYRLWRIQRLLAPQKPVKEVPKYEEKPLTKGQRKAIIIGLVIFIIVVILASLTSLPEVLR
jgi:hypothetical protein